MLRSGQTPDETYNDLNTKLASGQKWEGEFINKKKKMEQFFMKKLL